MKALFTGIYSHFTAESGGAHNTFYTNIGGRLYFTRAPQGATFPYAVFWMVSHSPEYYFNNELYEEFAIQFDLFDEDQSSSNIGTYVSNMQTLFDDAAVTVTGYGTLIFERELAHLLRHEDINIWQWAVEYTVLLEKE